MLDEKLTSFPLAVRTQFAGTLSAATVANLRWGARGGLPSQLAILQRGYVTDQSSSTSTSTSSNSFPPPGFDPKQAKEPLRQDKKNASAQTESGSATTQNRESDKARLDEAGSGSKVVVSAEDKKVAEEKKEEKKKLTIGQKIKKEVLHYWDGTKLLATEVRISTRLAFKMAGGYELSRREHRQVGLSFTLIWAGLVC